LTNIQHKVTQAFPPRLFINNISDLYSGWDNAYQYR
jgi:hypothetical protein